MTASVTLFDPIDVGAIRAANRAAMAPLTRSRAGAGNVPTALMAEYYAQRASAGLIIAEATQVCPEGQGYIATPGIHSAEQVEGWKAVTSAVHARGGRIVLQLWHVGRISHPFFQPGGAAPVAPSAIRPKMQAYTDKGMEDCPTPRALETSELPALVETFRRGAANAIAAGFDGVEIHAANGYLVDQFLRDGTNQRTDAYGGSIENRIRLLDEIARAVVAEVGADRTGVRISPVSPFNDIADSDPQALFGAVCDRLGALGLAYVHVIEGQTGGPRDFVPDFDFDALRRRFQAAGGKRWIVNNGYTFDRARGALAEGHADLVAFGVPFLANPDLLARFRQGAALNAPRPDLFYGGGAEGYTDYPTLA